MQHQRMMVRKRPQRGFYDCAIFLSDARKLRDRWRKAIIKNKLVDMVP
jgi:hypothetical protein